MDIDSKPDSGTAKDVSSPSARIAELNEIDKSITQLLASASEATAVLSNASDTTHKSLEDAEEAFRTASSNYFSTLSSIEVRLRRQVYALEEAGLIPLGTERDTRRGKTLTANVDGDDSGLSTRRTAGGGALDPSWLNARVSDSVEIRKKMELLEEGKRMVSELQRGVSPNKEGNDKMDEGEH